MELPAFKDEPNQLTDGCLSERTITFASDRSVIVWQFVTLSTGNYPAVLCRPLAVSIRSNLAPVVRPDFDLAPPSVAQQIANAPVITNPWIPLDTSVAAFNASVGRRD